MNSTEYNEKTIIGEKGFWQKWISKFLFTIISVKVWGLVAATWVSTYLLLIHNKLVITEGLDDGILSSGISGAQWLTFNTTIWALIFGMKEIFRITEKKNKDEQLALEQQSKSKEKIAAIVAEPENNSATKITKEGLEIVGEEPDNI